jgi:hypothetical protein
MKKKTEAHSYQEERFVHLHSDKFTGWKINIFQVRNPSPHLHSKSVACFGHMCPQTMGESVNKIYMR